MAKFTVKIKMNSAIASPLQSSAFENIRNSSGDELDYLIPYLKISIEDEGQGNMFLKFLAIDRVPVIPLGPIAFSPVHKCFVIRTDLDSSYYVVVFDFSEDMNDAQQEILSRLLYDCLALDEVALKQLSLEMAAKEPEEMKGTIWQKIQDAGGERPKSAVTSAPSYDDTIPPVVWAWVSAVESKKKSQASSGLAPKKDISSTIFSMFAVVEGSINFRKVLEDIGRFFTTLSKDYADIAEEIKGSEVSVVEVLEPSSTIKTPNDVGFDTKVALASSLVATASSMEKSYDVFKSRVEKNYTALTKDHPSVSSNGGFEIALANACWGVRDSRYDKDISVHAQLGSFFHPSGEVRYDKNIIFEKMWELVAINFAEAASQIGDGSYVLNSEDYESVGVNSDTMKELIHTEMVESVKSGNSKGLIRLYNNCFGSTKPTTGSLYNSNPKNRLFSTKWKTMLAQIESSPNIDYYKTLRVRVKVLDRVYNVMETLF